VRFSNLANLDSQSTKNLESNGRVARPAAGRARGVARFRCHSCFFWVPPHGRLRLVGWLLVAGSTYAAASASASLDSAVAASAAASTIKAPPAISDEVICSCRIVAAMAAFQTGWNE